MSAGPSPKTVKLTAGAVLILAPALFAFGQSSKSEISPQTRSLVREAIAATGMVLVRSSGDQGSPRPRGSAVLVSRGGIAATNLHVITDSRSGRSYDELFLALSSDGGASVAPAQYKLEVVVIDRELDLALLRVVRDSAGSAVSNHFVFPFVEIGDSKSMRLLDDIFIIGYPEKGGSTVTVNRGVIEGKDALGNWIKTDARVIHGNSGGAAVNSEGKLIGIPTKVVADSQPVDRDGDGFPDEYKRYGAVGFLRPAELVASMMTRLGNAAPSGAQSAPQEIQRPSSITVRGTVRSALQHKPIAGALVGLLPLGSELSPATLLSWGSTNPDGEFVMNKPVPPGRYTLRAKAAGAKVQTREVEITPDSFRLTIEL